jgi:hypothetical protein
LKVLKGLKRSRVVGFNSLPGQRAKVGHSKGKADEKWHKDTLIQTAVDSVTTWIGSKYGVNSDNSSEGLPCEDLIESIKANCSPRSPTWLRPGINRLYARGRNRTSPGLIRNMGDIMRNVTLLIMFMSSMYFTLSLCMCTVEFTGYTADGKKIINYEFASSHVEWGPTEIQIKSLKREVTTEKNVECDAYGWCGNDGTSSGWDAGYAHDCNGHRAFVTYEWREDLYRQELKLLGGRVIKGVEYVKENETIVAQAECIRDND